jgi:glycosyltransferase involved in cell wall biosynthesis
MWEWSHILARRLRFHAVANRLNAVADRSFHRPVTDLLRREPVDVIWGYNNCSLETFRWAKKRGIRCILDQTIGHPRSQNRVIEHERELHPDFFPADYKAISQAQIDLQDEETELADVVVVGCEFAKQTMLENGCNAEKLAVVPYGFDESLFPGNMPLREPLQGRRVRLLFVGTIEPRKGAAYLLEAVKQLPPASIETTLIGQLRIPAQTFARYRDFVVHHPQMSRAEVVRHFLGADCFVFPSLFEGGGIVLYEARGAGLGIIQSTYAGDGVATDGSNGRFLAEVTVSEVENAITEAVENRTLLGDWSRESWRLRGERTWKQYRAKVVDLVRSRFS